MWEETRQNPSREIWCSLRNYYQMLHAEMPLVSVGMQKILLQCRRHIKPYKLTSYTAIDIGKKERKWHALTLALAKIGLHPSPTRKAFLCNIEVKHVQYIIYCFLPSDLASITKIQIGISCHTKAISGCPFCQLQCNWTECFIPMTDSLVQCCFQFRKAWQNLKQVNLNNQTSHINKENTHDSLLAS